MKPSLGNTKSVMLTEDEVFSQWVIFYNGNISYDSELMPPGAGDDFASFIHYQLQYVKKQGSDGEPDITFERTGMDHAEARFHNRTGLSARKFAAFMEGLVSEAKWKNIPLMEVVASRAIKIINLGA